MFNHGFACYISFIFLLGCHVAINKICTARKYVQQATINYHTTHYSTFHTTENCKKLCNIINDGAFSWCFFSEKSNAVKNSLVCFP